MTTFRIPTIEHRVDDLAWEELRAQLDERGFAVTAPLLTESECEDLADLFDAGRFRSTIDMARHRFGDGRYRYFDHPLPDAIAALRGSFYRRLAPIANDWSERLGGAADAFPLEHEELLARCHEAGQRRPTPLLLTYGPGDYNCLHQDLYGEHVFPLQMAVLLDAPGRDFEGGEFVLVEQRPRQQSRPHVVPLRQGEGVIFAVRERPAQGARGVHRRALRHGVSELRAGERRTLGIILHDAA